MVTDERPAPSPPFWTLLLHVKINTQQLQLLCNNYSTLQQLGVVKIMHTRLLYHWGLLLSHHPCPLT